MQLEFSTCAVGRNTASCQFGSKLLSAAALLVILSAVAGHSICENPPNDQVLSDTTATLRCSSTGELTLDLELRAEELNPSNDFDISHVELRCISSPGNSFKFYVDELDGRRLQLVPIQNSKLVHTIEQDPIGQQLFPGAQCEVLCVHDDLNWQSKFRYFKIGNTSRCTVPALPPDVTDHDVTVIEEDRLNLTCINSNPPQSGVSQEWRDPEGMFLSNESSLLVESVTRSFSGAYTCVLTGANNYTIGDAVNVTVEYAPEVSTPDPTSRSVSVGGTAVLSCDYDGVPTPTVQWFHNGEELVNGTENVHIVDSDGISTLTLSNFGEEIGGVYTCIASNSVGNNSNVVMLVVPQPVEATSPTSSISTGPIVSPVTTTYTYNSDKENVKALSLGTSLPIATLFLIFIVIVILLAAMVKRFRSWKHSNRCRTYLHNNADRMVDPNFDPVKLQETTKFSRSLDTVIVSRWIYEEDVSSQENHYGSSPILRDVTVTENVSSRSYETPRAEVSGGLHYVTEINAMDSEIPPIPSNISPLNLDNVVINNEQDDETPGINTSLSAPHTADTVRDVEQTATHSPYIHIAEIYEHGPLSDAIHDQVHYD